MFKKKRKKGNFKYKTANQVIYGNVVLQKLKEIKHGKKIALFLLLFTLVAVLALIIIFIVFHFAGSGNNIQEVVSRN
ncbi:hypothetical protein [Mesomycoplasma ovipneumoniae]|uniref:hypothetical protein n=1 Tax=Mesomycoplasma ovipneumoniae TaxID=29562 RepID=UPI003080F2F2